MVLWAYSLKRGEFHHFFVTIRVIGVTVVLGLGCLMLVIGWG